LRFVAERAEVGEQHEAVFAVTIPEERGSFRRFCAALGRHSITEFNYRIGDASSAHIFVGVQIASRDEREALAAAFRAQAFDVLDLTDDELAKLHLRHMIGGRSPLARHERLYRFEFPERPGALTHFLGQLHPDWNISLFHYRNHGADYGRILVGIQVPPRRVRPASAVSGRTGLPALGRERSPRVSAAAARVNRIARCITMHVLQ
jgi:C-terminal regulatory domain of Threonine dehydratase.